jgi:menaquinone-dependent protoporphyrinogen oxidase
MGMTKALDLPDVPVFFATSEGQTQRIAERFAAALRRNGVDSIAIDIGGLDGAAIDWTAVRGAIVGASIHVGKHQRAARAFVAKYAAQLNVLPSLFYSVSLAAASQNRDEVRNAQAIADAFPAANGWHPQAVISLAGRLAYSQYNFIVRLLMKRIARKEGAPVDTSRDYEFTNWTRVDDVAREFATTVKRAAA